MRRQVPSTSTALSSIVRALSFSLAAASRLRTASRNREVGLYVVPKLRAKAYGVDACNNPFAWLRAKGLGSKAKKIFLNPKP